MPQTPRIPVVGEIIRNRGRLVEIIVPPPVQPPTQYVFRDVHFEVVVMGGDFRLESVVTFSNTYINCIDKALQEAKETLVSPKWNMPASGFRVDILEVVEEIVREVNQSIKDGEYYDRHFVNFKEQSLSYREIASRVIWSSLNPDSPPTPSPDFMWWNQPHWANKP